MAWHGMGIGIRLCLGHSNNLPSLPLHAFASLLPAWARREGLGGGGGATPVSTTAWHFYTCLPQFFLPWDNLPHLPTPHPSHTCRGWAVWPRRHCTGSGWHGTPPHAMRMGSTSSLLSHCFLHYMPKLRQADLPLFLHCTSLQCLHSKEMPKSKSTTLLQDSLMAGAVADGMQASVCLMCHLRERNRDFLWENRHLMPSKMRLKEKACASLRGRAHGSIAGMHGSTAAGRRLGTLPCLSLCCLHALPLPLLHTHASSQSTPEGTHLPCKGLPFFKA